MMVDSVDVECEAPDLPELTNGIGRCDREKFVTCHTSRLSIEDHIINHIAREIIKLDFSGNCLTKNCVYIIQCKQPGCNVQYMGVIDEMYPMTHKCKACSTLFKLCQCIINTLKFHNSSKF